MSAVPRYLPRPVKPTYAVAKERTFTRRTSTGWFVDENDNDNYNQAALLWLYDNGWVDKTWDVATRRLTFRLRDTPKRS